MDKYTQIWTEIRQFLFLSVILFLMWTWVSSIRDDVKALTGHVEASVTIARQVEYLLSTQGYVSAPLDPPPLSSSLQLEFPLTGQ